MATYPHLVGQKLSHYLILQQLGAGGMGVVYLAQDERLDRKVALKILPAGALSDENARKRFRKEALTLSKLNHPNIATVFDFDTQDATDFLVMEYVEGFTLTETLAKRGLPEKQILALGEQIAKTLEDAHEHRIVHCDLTPRNIMVTPKEQIKLLDFGLARLLRTTASASTESLIALHGAGTLPYIAPEQFRGELPDFRSDIYSLGAVLYEMCTRQQMFADVDRIGLVNAILHDAPRPPTAINPQISAGLETIILKALDKDPNRRYQSAEELSVDLSRLSTPVPPVTVGRTVNWTHRVILLMSCGAIATIAGIFAFERWRPLKHEPTRQSVLIADFENRTGEAVFDQAVPELLTTALEQSRYLSVFPSIRIRDALRRMERSDTVNLDEATGREICLREGLQALLQGSLSKIGKNYILVARAVGPDGGNLVSTEQVVPGADQVPEAVDSIAKTIRIGLGESLTSVTQSSVPLEKVTSKSLEAIRYFSLGKVGLYNGDSQVARGLFQRALELDPTFAMAHEYLGITYVHLNDPVRAKKELLDATRLTDRVTEIEKHKILGDYNLLVRNYDEAIGHFQLLIRLQPQDPAAYLNLGDCYAGKFQYDSAVYEVEKGVSLQLQSGPRDNLVEILLLKGDTTRALVLAQEILRKDPKDSRARNYLGKLYLLNGQPNEARRIFESVVDAGGDEEAEAWSALADLALATGRYREARSDLEAGIVADQKRGGVYSELKKRILLGTLTGDQGAILRFASALSKTDEPDPQLVLLLGVAFAQGHQLQDGQNMLRIMKRLVHQNPVPTTQSFQYLLAAELALARGSPLSALQSAQEAVHYENSSFALETLARCYEATGKYEDAIREYEHVLARSNERSHSYDTPAFYKIVDAHYRLGTLFESAGQPERARSNLQQFLKYWSQPDSDLEIYRDAERRLRTLTVSAGH
jgi:tetratricopeptide (TPR) repeat protein/predicted Ser/Thr protein kinase